MAEEKKDLDADSLKKLDPEEKAKKLKELIEKYNKELQEKNKEIEQAQKLFDQAEKEKKDFFEKIKVPDLEEINIADLFKKKEDRLEEKVESAPREEKLLSKEELDNLYGLAAKTPVNELYSNVMNLYSQAMGSGVNPAIAAQAGMLQYALERKQQDIDSGNYLPNQEMLNMANAAKTIADSILNMYMAGVKRKDTRME
jgi:hypothetical protein